MEMEKLIGKNKFPGQKFYLTKQGLERMKKEYGRLLEIKKMKAERGAPAIFHSEDLDPEYFAFFEDLDLLKVKMADLEYILKNAELVKAPPKKEQNAIGLGAKVLVQIDGANDDTFEIVGTLEANPSLGKISNESPVGRAFLGRKAGEEFIISSPIKTTYKIKKIIYPKG
jgi:transcription elongation factor GreA